MKSGTELLARPAAHDAARVRAHGAVVKRLGHWTSDRHLDVRASRGSVVLDLRSPGIADGDWNGVVWVIVFVTVGGAGCRSLRSCALSTIRMAMTIANAPSTPAAHSSARWPDENVRRGGVGGRWLPVAGHALGAGAGARTVGSAAARACVPEGTVAGAARPMDGA